MQTIRSTFSLWKPAIHKINESSHFKIDKTTIAFRTGLVAISSLAMLSLIYSRLSERSLLTQFLFVLLCPRPRIPSIHSLYPPLWEIYWEFEHERATKALHDIAIQQFESCSSTIPNALMDYFKQNSVAIQKLAYSKTNLEKMNQNGETLLKSIINSINLQPFLNNRKPSKLEEAFKAVIDSGALINTDLLNILKMENSSLTIYALEKGKIDCNQLTEKEKFACWDHVKNSQIAKLLKEKGFNINIQNPDSDCQTPLLKRIEDYRNPNSHLSDLIALLQNGASVPDKIPVNREEISIEEFLKDKPKLKTVLKQAKNFRETSSQPQRHYDFFVRLLGKPSIDENSFEIKNDIIIKKTIGVALSIFALSALFIRRAPTSFPFVSFLMIFSFLYHQFERLRARQTLNDFALKQFQKMFPSFTALFYALTQEELIDQLIKNHFDFTKVDNCGITLANRLFVKEQWASSQQRLSRKSDFSIFKKITDQLFHSNFSFSEEEKIEYLLKTIECRRQDYTQYLLERGYINKNNLTSDQQIKCWTVLTNASMAEFLKNKGFDPNIRECL